MKVLFVNYHHLDSNSGVHIFNLANHLTGMGVECVVCVPWAAEKVNAVGLPKFEVIEFDRLRREKVVREFDLIHFWTPREIVRRMSVELLEKFPAPYLVHLEDNEDYLIDAFSRLPIRWIMKLPSFMQKYLFPSNISHPSFYKEFLGKSTAITVITDSLKEICPSGIPTKTIWAGYQEELKWDMPPDSRLREELRISVDDYVVVYTGNVHPANHEEVASLYRAIWYLNQRGFQTKLIRTGIDHVPFLEPDLIRSRNNFCIELGYVSRVMLPSLLSIATVLVQPGSPGKFNDYRFPSKIPEYLASGKPVILPKTNIGLFLRDGQECLLLENGGVVDIAQKLESLFVDIELREKIGRRGKRFAEKQLKWGYLVNQLFDFYLFCRDKK